MEVVFFGKKKFPKVCLECLANILVNVKCVNIFYNKILFGGSTCVINRITKIHLRKGCKVAHIIIKDSMRYQIVKHKIMLIS